MKITRVQIKNYRGVSAADIPVGPGGIIAKGKCESGKTSFLAAIQAALLAHGVDPSDIRAGADSAEILVDFDALKSRLHARRKITASGNSLSVRNEDGFQLDSPQTRMRELLGGGGFDPIVFFMAKPKERRQIILDATPSRVTADDVKRWIPGEKEPAAVVSLDGHGFDVLAKLRAHYYNLRTDANKAAKASAEDAARAEKDAATLADKRNDDLDGDAIAAEAERARAVVADIAARMRAAEKAHGASAETRGKIAALRSEADLERQRAVAGRPASDIAARSSAEVESCAAEVKRLRAALKAAEEAELVASKEHDRIGRLDLEARRADQRADDATKRAEELEAALANAAPEVTPEEMETSRLASNAASDQMTALVGARLERAARDKAEKHRIVATVDEECAGGLDRIVDTLTNVAPKELAARGNAISGFDIEAMALDGVPLDSLSGAQKLEFAINLAKRAHPEAKILICDGLERLDGERMEAFIRIATADGWQLLASRVESGQIYLKQIET